MIQGAGRGLGLAPATRLLRDGRGHVTATARAPGDNCALQRLLSAYGRERLTIEPLDITREAGIMALRQRLGQRCVRLHLMMTCAGLLHDDAGMWPEKKLSDIKPGIWP